MGQNANTYARDFRCHGECHKFMPIGELNENHIAGDRALRAASPLPAQRILPKSTIGNKLLALDHGQFCRIARSNVSDALPQWRAAPPAALTPQYARPPIKTAKVNQPGVHFSSRRSRALLAL
jgi:hypothetical protein